MSSRAKIDCHSHIVPPNWREACEKAGYGQPDGMPAIPPWSEESHLSMMESVNITRSIVSITSPGVHLKTGDDAAARSLARYCNEYAADMKSRRPRQFGFWASLPLPDVQGTLEEIRYASSHLQPDGFVMETNYHGTYLGDKSFEPVFDELNRRKATIFIHPTSPCLPSGQTAVPIMDYPRPIFEFFFDTARAVIHLFLSGTIRRHPDITWIIPHVGGALPPLIKRFTSVSAHLHLPGVDQEANPAWVKERLNSQFYFDTAGFALPEQLRGLLEFVSVERIVYGSDFPYTPLKAVQFLSEEHDRYLPEIFPKKEDQEAVCFTNAEALAKK